MIRSLNRTALKRRLKEAWVPEGDDYHAEALAYIKLLEKALRVYAKREFYKGAGADSYSPAEADAGTIARNALGTKEKYEVMEAVDFPITAEFGCLPKGWRFP